MSAVTAYIMMEPLSLGDTTPYSLTPSKLHARLPGIRCDTSVRGCGATWGTANDRVRTAMPEDHFLFSEKPWPLPPEPFFCKKADVLASLNLPDMPLLPGTQFGFMRLQVDHRKIADVEWPPNFSTIVTSHVVDLLTENHLTGWHVEPVVLEPGPLREFAPPLFEFVIHGRGGKAVTEPETHLLSRCKVCGRQDFARGKLHAQSLDVRQWDGSDFFLFDAPEAGYYYATERVRTLFEQHSIKDVEFRDMGWEYPRFGARVAE